MPKAQNHKGYSCRVNILKYVKVADKWRFAPARTQINKLKQDWVLGARQPGAACRRDVLHRMVRDSMRCRQGVPNPGAVL